MRRARWVCCATSIWCGYVVALAQPADHLQRIGQAELQVVRLAPGAAVDALRPDPAVPWQRIELPLTRESEQPIPRGQGSHLLWLRLRYRPQHSGATALFVTRADLGEVFALVGEQRLEDGHWERSPRWNGPLLFVAPAGALRRDTDNEILLAMRTPMERLRFGSVEIGPHAGRVLEHYQRWMFMAWTLPRVVTVLALALAGFGIAVWWRRRSETAYLMLTFGMLAWVTFLLPFYYYPTDRFEPFGLYWNATAAALPWVVVLNYLFVARLVGARRSMFDTVLLAYAAVSSAITLSLGWVGDEVFFGLYRLTVFQLPALVASVAAVMTVRLAWQVRTREAVAVAGALIVECALGVHDALRIRGVLSSDNPVLVPFAALVVLLAFGYAVMRRYVGSLAAAEQSASMLDRQLAERTRELEASHSRLREIERERALADERQRLMREMHDGMGSALMGSLMLVEQGQLDRAAVARVLRDSIDELKLTIDSLEPIGGDLPTLLATLRYRLGRRLEGAGLAFDWSVGDLPVLPWLDANASLHVLRILQEALINVARHAQASAIRIETGADEHFVSVCVVDNGRGFDVEHCLTCGHGLRNMMRRAQALGGRVTVTSRPGETMLRLQLPRDR